MQPADRDEEYINILFNKRIWEIKSFETIELSVELFKKKHNDIKLH